jgi:predicted ATPase
MNGHHPEEAERCFSRALEIATRQEAKSLELRATLSLSQVLAAGGRTADAKRMLTDIYSSFSEGFESPDLRNARTALESLK